MRNTVVLVVLCLGLAGIMREPRAEDNSTPPHFHQPLTLIQLTSLAQENNPSTKVAWAQIQESEAGVALARAGYWPQVTGQISAQRSSFVNFSGTSSGSQTRYGPSVSLSYLLWDFGNRAGGLDGAKFTLASTRLARDQTLQDVILQVEQDYYQVSGLQALVDANEQSVKDAEASLDAAHQRQHTGLATIGDIYQAEAALAGARLTLQQSEGQLAAARGQLATTVGYSPDVDLPLAPWQKKIDTALPKQSIADLLEQARNVHPSLLAAKANQQAALANLEVVRAKGLPSLSFDANAGITRTVGVADSSNYSAGITVSIPIFAGFGDRAANRQAQARVDVEQATVDQLRQQVELEVWQAYQNLKTTAATLDTSAAQLKSARQADEVASARYKAGLASILDVLSAQSTLATARAQQVQAQLNWFAGLAALGHAVGGLAMTDHGQGMP